MAALALVAASCGGDDDGGSGRGTDAGGKSGGTLVFGASADPAGDFDTAALFSTLDEAEKETDQEDRTDLYEEANRMIMELLPGVPYIHTKPALAFAKNVKGYVPSPVSLEPFSNRG